jgi:hypothetical protein
VLRSPACTRSWACMRVCTCTLKNTCIIQSSVCVSVCVCARACARVCSHACVRACFSESVSLSVSRPILGLCDNRCPRTGRIIYSVPYFTLTRKTPCVAAVDGEPGPGHQRLAVLHHDGADGLAHEREREREKEREREREREREAPVRDHRSVVDGSRAPIDCGPGPAANRSGTFRLDAISDLAASLRRRQQVYTSSDTSL